MILQNNAATTITSGGGTVTFGADLEANGLDNDSLVISSGAGNVTFTGAIGATHELGGLDVNATTAGSGDITFSSNIGKTAGGGAAGVIGTTAIGTTSTDKITLRELFITLTHQVVLQQSRQAQMLVVMMRILR